MVELLNSQIVELLNSQIVELLNYPFSFLVLRYLIYPFKTIMEVLISSISPSANALSIYSHFCHKDMIDEFI
jgi:hypothetical protein